MMYHSSTPGGKPEPADELTEAQKSADAFTAFLHEHHLDLLTVSIQAGIRFTTVWNIQQGKPVTQEHANTIRYTLQKMTGVAYTAALYTGEQ